MSGNSPPLLLLPLLLLLLLLLLLVALVSLSPGMNTEGYETVVPWMKQPKLTANTNMIWVNLRASAGSEERLKYDYIPH